jgi:hypothetical protein
MSFISEYFLDDIDNLMSFYGPNWRTEYKYILYKNSLISGYNNAGGFDTTDWLDDDSDGLANGYTLFYNVSDAIPSIITGSGFTGRAQITYYDFTEDLIQIQEHT